MLYFIYKLESLARCHFLLIITEITRVDYNLLKNLRSWIPFFTSISNEKKKSHTRKLQRNDKVYKHRDHPLHKQTRTNNTRSIKYSNIEEKKKEGRKNTKFTRLLSKIVAAINPSDQLTRDRWQGVKIKEKNEAERVERKQRRGEWRSGRSPGRNEYSSIYFMARIA